MNEPIKLAILGLSHDHVWDNLPALSAHPDIELIAASDPNEPLTKRIASEYGCKTYDKHEALLEKEHLEAVAIFSSNAEGAELAIQAMDRKLHVLIEKPMAARLDQADRMLETAAKQEVKLMINWPFAWWPQLQLALALAQKGELGDVWAVKYRAAHAGPAELGCSEYFCDWLFQSELNGAGALMDYCCYGCVLSVCLLGIPETVTGITGGQVKPGLSVEDNALIAMKYPFGMSSAEASWTQVGKLTSYTTAIYGTRATLMVEPRVGGRLLLASDDHPEGKEVSVPDSEPWLQNPANHFVEVIRQDADPWMVCNPVHSRNAQEILEAGLRSAKSGHHQKLPLQ